MRKNLGDTEDKLEAQTIAQSEWERLSHMSLDELEAKRDELAEKYSAGTDSQYEISVKLGEKGTFNDGTCGVIGSDGYSNCFKNTTITVYRDGERLFTTRTLPLMAGDYTRKEIDNKLSNEAKARSDKDIDLQKQIENNKWTRMYRNSLSVIITQQYSGGDHSEYTYLMNASVTNSYFLRGTISGVNVDIPYSSSITNLTNHLNPMFASGTRSYNGHSINFSCGYNFCDVYIDGRYISRASYTSSLGYVFHEAKQ